MKIWLYCSQEMSPAPLAPRSFLEVPVNSGGGWVVAEEGVPGKEGLGTGMGIAEPARCAYVCVCLCVREADELHRHCEQQW